MASFDEEEETTSPEKRAAMYDPSRRSDPQAREKADHVLLIAAERARLETRIDILERRARADAETITALRNEIARLRRK